jgi:hypothetical protein
MHEAGVAVMQENAFKFMVSFFFSFFFFRCLWSKFARTAREKVM